MRGAQSDMRLTPLDVFRVRQLLFQVTRPWTHNRATLYSPPPKEFPEKPSAAESALQMTNSHCLQI